MATVATLAGSLILDSVGYTAGLENAARQTVEFQNRAAPAIRGVAGDVEQLTVKTEDIGQVSGWAELEQKLLGVSDATQETTAATQELGQETQQAAVTGTIAYQDLIDKVMKLGGITLSVAGAMKAIEKTIAFGEAGAELLNLDNGLERTAEEAGTTKEALETAFAGAAEGIVQTDDLARQFILTSRAVGTSLGRDFPDLVRMGMASAAEGIGDTLGNLELIDLYIRTGFARGLKNQLGLIMPTDAQLMGAYAESIGKVADQLTEEEQAQGRLNAVLEAGRARWDLENASADMAGMGLARLKTQAVELTEGMQKNLAPSIDETAASLADLARVGGTAANIFTALYAARQKATMATEGVLSPAWMSRLQLFGPATAGVLEFGAALESVERGPAKRTMDALEPIMPTLEKIAMWVYPAVKPVAGLLGVDKVAIEQERVSLANLNNEQAAMVNVQERYAAAIRATREEFARLHPLQAILTELGQTRDTERYAAQLGEVRSELEKSTVPGEHLADTVRRLTAEETAAAGAASVLRFQSVFTRSAMHDLAGSIGEVITAEGRLVRESKGMGGAIGSLEELAIATVRYQNAVLGLEGPQANEYATDWDYRIARLEYDTGEIVKGHEEAATKSIQAWETFGQKLDTYISNWKSAVQSLLAPTGTLNPEDMLAATGQSRETFDESRKRAEAVFLDYGNTAKQAWFAGWAEQVEFPIGASNDAARAWAARYVDEFTRNLHPEDINMEAVIGSAQRLVESNLGQQDITQQVEDALVNAGLGPQNPAVMQAFDFPGIGDQGGVDLATNMASAMLAYNWKGAGKTLMGTVVQGAAEAASSASDAVLQALAGPLYPIIKKKLQDEGLFRPPSQ